jgi:hypothetical protein
MAGIAEIRNPFIGAFGSKSILGEIIGPDTEKVDFSGEYISHDHQQMGFPP